MLIQCKNNYFNIYIGLTSFYYYKGTSFKEVYLNLKLLTMKDAKKIFLPLIAGSLLIWSTFATNSVNWNWSISASWQADSNWNVSGQASVNWNVSSTNDNTTEENNTTDDNSTQETNSTSENNTINNDSIQRTNSNQADISAQNKTSWEVKSENPVNKVEKNKNKRKGFVRTIRWNLHKRIKNVREHMKKVRERTYKFVTKKLQKRIDVILENKLFKRIANLSQQKQELVLNKISKKVDKILNIINSKLEKKPNNRWLKVKKEILEYLKEKVDQKLSEINVSWSVSVDATINWVLWK